VNRTRIRWEWLVAVLLGFGIGLVYAWLLSPVQFVDAGPDMLASEFKDDFRVAIASAFAANGDLDRARARLVLLGEENSAETLTAQAQRMLAAGESFESIQNVARLAAALQGQSVSRPVTTPPSATNASNVVLPTLVDKSPTLTLEASSQIIQAELTATSAPPLPATARPTRTATPTIGAPYQLVGEETICDPILTERILQIVVINSTRKQVPGVEIVISWASGEEHVFTGLKPEIGNGYADYSMTSDTSYSVRLVEGGSPASNISTPPCTDPDGNPYEGGVRLTFQQP